MSVFALSLFGWDVTLQVVVTGAVSGLTYALLAAGLVLIYRATAVFNFAHGEFGAFGAAVFAKLVLDEHWDFLPALGVAVAIGVAVGAVVDLVVVRRLANASRVVLLVATIGVSQVMLFAQTQLPGLTNTAPYPSGLDASVSFLGVTLRGEHLAALIAVPLVMAGLAWFLTRSESGLAVQASADNTDAARLAGINIRRVSTIVWMVAGGLAVLTFVLNSPMRGTIAGITTQGLGPSLLLRALAAAMVGRFVSLPMTLLGGVLIGVFEAICFVNVSSPGTVDAFMFVLVLVLLLVRMRGADAPSGGAIVELPPVRVAYNAVVRRSLVGLSIASAVLLPLIVTSPSQHFLFARVAIYAVIGLSVVVITGWAGQLSLCQFAMVGVGAVMTNGLVGRGVPYGWALVYACAAGFFVAMLIGAPALRARGLLLAVATIAFAVAASGWLLPKEWFFPGGGTAYIPRGKWWIIDLTSNRAFYYFALVVALLALAMVRRLRFTGIGRSIIAVRENEHSAMAMTLVPARVKLVAFGLSGVLAALAGGLLAGATVQFGVATFLPDESLRVVAMTVIGGVGSAGGAVVGALYLLGLPALFGDTASVRLLTSGIGLVAVLLVQPGGLARLLERVPFGRQHVAAPPDQRATKIPAQAPSLRGLDVAEVPDVATGRVLEASDVTVRFGGLVAVDAVSIEVDSDEIVGLIGTNGAGKSTFLNAISGFVPLRGGSVSLFGEDISGLTSPERARLGIGRVFQDARLYGALTAREAVQVALEARERTEVLATCLALGPARRGEAAKRRRADELLGELGLGSNADDYVANLSTGTRRLVELACLLAVEPRLLLLDEPTAGMAGAETEAFVPLIRTVQRELRAPVVLIEHDMSVVMALSGRLYCMEAGRVIAAGTPEQIRRDPLVIASYLGGSGDAGSDGGADSDGSDSKAGPRRRSPLAAGGPKR